MKKINYIFYKILNIEDKELKCSLLYVMFLMTLPFTLALYLSILSFGIISFQNVRNSLIETDNMLSGLVVLTMFATFLFYQMFKPLGCNFDNKVENKFKKKEK